MNMYTILRKGWMILLLVFALTTATLVLPQSVTPVEAASAAHAQTIHVVARGDTLTAIARHYGTSVAAIKAANHLRSDTIYVGQRLIIPGGMQQPAPGESITYTVRPGDTLSAIARRFGTTVAAIQSANHLTSDRIYVGQRLTIPPASYPTQPTAQRIQFAPGATSALVSGTVRYPTRNSYLLRAAAGQTMRVELVSDYGIANFSVQGSDGTPLKRLENSNTVWTGTLPSTQDYLIQIATLEGSSPGYSLYVEIK